MTNTTITERQRYWRDHVLAAAAYSGTIVEYAETNNLKTKDIYQWKTSLTKRGFLPLDKEPETCDFIPVQPVAPTALDDQTEMTCRLTLACGAVLEFYTPLDSAVLPKLLSAIQRN